MPRSALPGEALRECHRMAKDARGPILECGSGLSTLVMGLALRGSQHELYSLENDLDWIERVKVWLDRYGAENVNLIYAPLHPHRDHDFGRWYGIEPDDLPVLFDGVLIDGPARKNAKRNIVFDVLGDKIKHARTWVIDDVEGDQLPDSFVAGREVIRRTGMSAGFPHEYAIARRTQAKQEAAE